LKYIVYSVLFLSLICIDISVKTYEMFNANAECLELLSEKKSEKEVEDIDEIDKLICSDFAATAANKNFNMSAAGFFYSSERYFGSIPEPPPDQMI